MVPYVLKNMNLLVDGFGYAGKVTALTPPKLSRKVEEFRAGGMDGSVELDMGLEKLEATFTLAEFDKGVLALWNLRDLDSVLLRFRGAIERDDTGDVRAVEVTLRGRWKELDHGDWKPGEKAELKVTVACTFYSYSEDGVPLIVEDVVNMISLANGVDRLSGLRTALGV